MGRAVKIPLNCSPIDYAMEEIKDDLSSSILIFPGKRPVVYMRKLLAQRMGRALLPPKMFPVEGFIREIHRKFFGHFKEPTPQEAAFIIHKIGKQLGLKVFSSFATSFFWAMRFYEAFEEMEREMIEDDKLRSATEQPEFLEIGSLPMMINSLCHIRNRFREEIKSLGMRTPGMIYREVAENIKEKTLPWEGKYIFVGLSALTRSEREILGFIMERQDSVFIYQIPEGSDRIYRYLNDWGVERQEIEGQEVEPQIKLYSGPGDHGQIIALSKILSQEDFSPSDTVIVLPDPSLLLSLLSGVISSLSCEYNVSLGYPISRTPVYALLERAMALQETKKNGLYNTGRYLELLLHPYVKNLYLDGKTEPSRIIAHNLEELLIDSNKPFVSLEEIENMDLSTGEVDREKARQHIKTIHRVFIKSLERVSTIGEVAESLLRMLMKVYESSPARFYPLSGPFFSSLFSYLEDMKNSLFAGEKFHRIEEAFSILRNGLLYVRVPFEGVPLKGLQILGQLETRALRFKNVIYLSANENVLPGTEPVDPLLPTRIRNYLGLPTYRDREKLIRHYFMRLVKGAERVSIIYDSKEDAFRSRFVEELVWEREKKGKELKPIIISSPVIVDKKIPRIEKDEKILEKLKVREFSPTSIDKYLNCPFRFYAEEVVGIGEREKIEEGIEGRSLGIFLHRVLEKYYRSFEGKLVEEKDHSISKLEGIIDSLFKTSFPSSSGEFLLLKEMVKIRLRRYIEEEKSVKFKILALERKLNGMIETSVGEIKIHGRIDRLQKKGEEIQVLDYKLSGGEKPRRLQEVLSSRKDMGKSIKSFQLPIYLYLAREEGFIEGYENSDAGLVNLANGKVNFLFASKKQRIDPQERPVQMEYYINSLRNLLEEILNPEIPFVAEPIDERKCAYCPFRALCGR